MSDIENAGLMWAEFAGLIKIFINPLDKLSF